MGLKSGSRDTGLDDEEEADTEAEQESSEQTSKEPDDTAETTPETETPSESESTTERESSRNSATSTTDSAPSADRNPAHGTETGETATDDTSTREASTRNTSTRDTKTETEPGNQSNTGTSADDRPSRASIPYKLRREKVNEDREQIPFFLRDEVVADERDLREQLEETLGETVYKSDYREAAMIVAQENPGLVAEVLRDWGYDL